MANMSLMSELGRITSYSAALQIAKKAKLKALGKGSSRIVYALDEHTVIKIALNDDGVEQNEAESDLSEAPITTKVLDMHEEAYWIIVERATPLTTNAELFRNIVGVSFGTFAKGAMNALGISNFSTNEIDMAKLELNPFYQRIVRFIRNHDLSPADATKLTSYGIVGNHIVLIDYGLTAEQADLF